MFLRGYLWEKTTRKTGNRRKVEKQRIKEAQKKGTT
jgi:hypothetical protein